MVRFSRTSGSTYGKCSFQDLKIFCGGTFPQSDMLLLRFKVHGRGLAVSLEPSVALAADAPANMMPWAGDPKVIIDRFDGRAALDLIPEYLAGPDHEENSETREEKNERRSINYER